MTVSELTAEEIFRLNPKIRWAGFATPDGSVKFSKMRAGVNSRSPQSDDEAFMQMGPQMILALFERFVKYVGEVGIAAAEYEKIFMFVAKVKGGYIALTIDKQPQAEENVSRIFKSIREIQ